VLGSQFTKRGRQRSCALMRRRKCARLSEEDGGVLGLEFAERADRGGVLGADRQQFAERAG
jgi:hypothetical protein